MPTPNIPPPDPENPLDAFWPSPALEAAFHEALGQFVAAYGRTESALNYYLGRFAARAFGNDTKEGHALARASFGSQRYANLAETLKRLMRVAGHDEVYQTELADALKHMSDIHKMRDRIVHQGAAPEFHDGRWMIRSTNLNLIKEAHGEEEVYFTIENLEEMTSDLDAIRVRIGDALFLRERGEVEKTQGYRNVRKPWQYRPAQLVLHGPSIGTKRKKSSRQP